MPGKPIFLSCESFGVMVDELYCFLPIGFFIRYSQPLRKQTKVGRDLGLLNRNGGNRNPHLRTCQHFKKSVNLVIGRGFVINFWLSSSNKSALKRKLSVYRSRLWNSLLWSVISASLIERLKRYCLLILYCRLVSLSTKLRPLLSYQTSNVFLPAFLDMPNTSWVTSPI